MSTGVLCPQATAATRFTNLDFKELLNLVHSKKKHILIFPLTLSKQFRQTAVVFGDTEIHELRLSLQLTPKTIERVHELNP